MPSTCWREECKEGASWANQLGSRSTTMGFSLMILIRLYETWKESRSIAFHPNAIDPKQTGFPSEHEAAVQQRRAHDRDSRCSPHLHWACGRHHERYLLATVKSSVGASAGQGRDGQWAQEHEAFHHEHIGLCQQTKPQHHAKVVGMPEKGLSYHRLHFQWSAHDPKPRSAFCCAETTCPWNPESAGKGLDAQAAKQTVCAYQISHHSSTLGTL